MVLCLVRINASARNRKLGRSSGQTAYFVPGRASLATSCLCIPAFQELPAFDDCLALISILARDTDEVTQWKCERGALSGVKVALQQI